MSAQIGINKSGTAPRSPLIGALLLVMIFFIGNNVLPLGKTEVHWWADLGWTLASGLAAWRCLALARRLRGSEALAWRLFGLGCLAWFLGMLYWDVQELVIGKVTPFPALSDLGFLAFVPLFAAGLIFYRHTAPSVSFTVMETSQIGIFIACIIAAHIVIFYAPAFQQGISPLYQAIALAYPVLYMSLLVQVVSGFWTHDGIAARRPLVLVAAAIAIHAVTNSFYAYSLLGQDYEAGAYIDVGWVAGFALIYCAAEARWRARAAWLPATPMIRHPMRLSSLVPAVTLLVTLSVVMLFRDRLLPEMISLLEPVAFALVILLGVREWAGHAFKAQLLAAEQASERRFRTVFASMPAMASISRLSDGRFLNVNDTFLAVTGHGREEVLGHTSHELGMWIAPDNGAAIVAKLRQGGKLSGMDWSLRVKSGEIRQVLGSFELVILGSEECLLMIGQDVTERRRAESHMKKLSGALEQTADAVMIADRSGVIEYVNHAFVAVTGYQVEEALGRRPNILNSGKQGQEFYREVWDTILSGKVYSDVFINKRKDGSLYYEEKTITPLKDDTGEITHFISTSHDITERMQTQERLHFLAHHDLLTGLPNRSLFIDRLKQALAYARWHQRLVAVLFIDIDRFKTINDTLGHEVGDELLRAIAGRLERCLRDRDTVARFGGDEFVVVLNDIASSADVGQLAKKLLDVMQPPFTVNDDITLHVTASIGISLFPGDGDEAGGLLSRADTAMYRAKDTGRNHYRFYSTEMGARAFERLSMENSLRLALERDQFVLHYQPQIDGRDGRIIGVEALLRWQHPDMGLVSPMEFIPLLEDTGLIVQVGEWVLHTACRQLGRWRKTRGQGLRMAVNMSSIQFGSATLPQVIARALADNGLSPEHLELEITESILMRRDGTTSAMLQSLNDMGLRLGLDDFGTGYSSLSYLRRFPIDTLKIDRSFIRDIPGDAEDAAITQAIIVMGQSLKLELIAEGVETETQAAYLQSLGCHLMQGFLFSQPLPAEEVSRLLEAPGSGAA